MGIGLMGRRRKIDPFHTLIDQGYEKKVLAKIGGENRRATQQELMAIQIVKEAFAGNKKARRILIARLEEGARMRRRKGYLDIRDWNKTERRYPDDIRRITYDDGRVEWEKEDLRGNRESISAPTPAQLRRLEWDD